MRIVDYSISRCRHRRAVWQTRATEALLLELPEQIVLFAAHKAQKEHSNINLILHRSRYLRSTMFNLNALSEMQSLRDFRFKKADVGRLCEMIDWNGPTTRNQYNCHPLTATCLFLQRLATTVRWYDVEAKFGLFQSQMSEVFWEVVEKFTDKYSYVLKLRGNFLRERAHRYAQAIQEAGAPLPRCVGFIDCTKIRMSRPGGHGSMQRSCYSGHKRFHCLIYQTITTPDGLMFALFGPELGRRHDLTLYRESGWEPIMENFLHIDGVQFYIFGDSAYLLRPWMQRPFFRELATLDEKLFNTAMSSVRVAVEHNYKDLKQYWVSQDFARNLRVKKAPIALLYRASAILLNFQSCLYRRGQIVDRFDVTPPSLEEYLGH